MALLSALGGAFGDALAHGSGHTDNAVLSARLEHAQVSQLGARLLERRTCMD